MDKKFELIREKISSADSILITSHKRPDGDAVGSVIGLGLALQDSGKKVEMVIVDGIPKNFSHLVGSEKISRKINHDYDISIILDCSELKRIGFDIGEDFIPTINIVLKNTRLILFFLSSWSLMLLMSLKKSPTTVPIKKIAK